MAIERLKFRCYRCNQLLGATPQQGRLGRHLSQVQCRAAHPRSRPRPGRRSLTFRLDHRCRHGRKFARKPGPSPMSRSRLPQESIAAATAVQPASRPLPSASSLDELAAVLPPDLIDLKPEDLRVEAEFFESLTRQPAPSVVQEPAPGRHPRYSGPRLHPKPTSLRCLPLPPSSRPLPHRPSSRRLSSHRRSTLPPGRPSRRRPSAAERAEAALIGASIEIEHPTILPPGTEIRRVRDVVLPASVVLSWSLFVLLGIALSFVAGLLMGHFLWITPLNEAVANPRRWLYGEGGRLSEKY